jgi:hypothetical protein
MSAANVRDAFRAALAPLLVPAGFAFIESINKAETTKSLPDKWFTLDFLATDDSRAALGVPTLFRESGRCTVLIFTPHNIFDTDAVAAAEIVRAAMCNWFDSTGQIRVLAAQPPTDLDGGDFRGSFYGITVDLTYQADRLA